MIRSELDVLLERVEDPALREDLRTQIDRLKERRSFGLVFEQHIPERVRLPQHPIRIGSQVVSRDDADSPTYEVLAIEDGLATVELARDPDGAYVRRGEHPVGEHERLPLHSLVVITDFGEPVLPGFRSLDTVERGGDKPYHVVINGENHHALEALRFTHAGKVDCIYIDPPYNSGARDWKYNNDYVDETDGYRHSKWLAFMERRLKLAKELLNPDDSVLIVTIDEKEYLRLGLLLAQTFGAGSRKRGSSERVPRMQMVSITNNPKGAARENEFTRVDEYAFFLMFGGAGVPAVGARGSDVEVRWRYLRRTDIESRGTKKGGPRQFYPIYVDPRTSRIVELGDPLPHDAVLETAPEVPHCVPVFPIDESGQHMNWGLTAPSLRKALDAGYVRVSPGHEHQPYTIAYLTQPNIDRVKRGELVVSGGGVLNPL